MIGFGIALRWSWLVMLVPVAIAAVQWLAVSREEEHLERRFGSDWRAYASRVRRWL
jgi:protein-S-isoprenylcysteine O-methyltransferase Ste14